MDLCFGAVCKSCVFGYLPQSFPVKLPVVFIHGAYRAFQLGGFGYHVPGISCLDAGYAQKRGMKGVDISAHYGLESLYHGRGGGNGINAVIGMGAVAACAFDGNHKTVHCGGHIAFTDADGVHRIGWVAVDSPDPLHSLHEIGFQDFQRSQGGFLRRLEDDAYLAFQGFSIFMEKDRGSKAGRDMEIMAAGMHFPGIFRTVGKLCFFRDRQGVNIAAKRLDRAFLFSPDNGGKAGFQIGRQNFNAGFLQKFPDPGRSLIFLVGKLRMLVKPAEGFH